MKGVGDMKKVEKVVNKIYENRVLSRMSQAALAEKVGVSKQTIHLLEKGEGNPSLLLAYRISNYFGKQIEDMFIYVSYIER